MRIYLEAEHTKRQKTGVGYYTHNLINALQRVDKKNDYTLLYWKLIIPKNYAPIKITSSNFKSRFIRFSYHIYYKLFKLGLGIPLNFFIRKPDVILFTNFVCFPIFGSKTIVVVYDLSYKRYPQYSDEKNQLFLNKFVPEAIRKADHIITISENSKKEIIKFYNVLPETISIIYPSFNKKLFSPKSRPEVRKIKEKYRIPNYYFLFTSSLEPRKNVKRIVEAYHSLPREAKDKYSLVLAGGKGWQDEGIWKTIDKAQKSGDKIITTGYIPEEDLPALYSGAFIFLYPSIYEGFGIPILEAMVCGVPVLTSNTSSMPEVGGNAAFYVNPQETEEIKNGILKILQDKDLREKMIEAGFKQINKFSWEDSAEKLVKIFEEIYKEGK